MVLSVSYRSVIICVSLHGNIVYNCIALYKCLVWLTIHSLNRRSVQVDLGVDDQERIVRVEHIVIDADTIEVLLEKTLEEHVLLLESCLLLFDGELVKENLVVSLVEVVQKLELVVLALSQAIHLFDVDVRNLFGELITLLVEGKHFLFFSFELSTEFGCFEDFFSKLLVALESIHTRLRVHSKITKSFLFLVSGNSHGPFKVVIMLDDLVSFSLDSLVTLFAILFVLLNFQIQECGLLLQSTDGSLVLIDVNGTFLICYEKLSILISFMLGVRDILLEATFELFVELFDFADELLLHAFQVFHVLVLCLLTSAVIGLLHLVELVLLLLFDCLNHVSELLPLHVVTHGNLAFLGVKLGFDDAQVSFKLLFEAI